MPRFNASGTLAAFGVGDGPLWLLDVASRQGRVIVQPGGPCDWIDDQSLAFQTRRGDGSYGRATYDVSTGQLDILNGPGANAVAGGGGKVLWWTAGVGVTGSVTDPGAGLSPGSTDSRGEIGHDGTIALKPDYHGDGIQLIAPNGEVTATLPGVLGLQVLGPQLAIWNGGALGWNPQRLPGESWTRVADVNGVLWLVSWLEGVGLVAHRSDDASRGYVVTRSDAFYHDAVGRDGRLFVVYSTNQGESFGSGVLVDVFAECQESDLQPTVPVLAPYPRRLWVLPYWSHGRYGDTPTAEHVGNALLLNEYENQPDKLPQEIARLSGLGLPMFVQGNRKAAEVNVAQTVGWWAPGGYCSVAHDGRTSLKDSVLEVLQRPARPIVAYLDRTVEPFDPLLDWPASRPDWINGRVWPTVQCYRNKGESLSGFRGRIEATLNRVSSWGVPLGLELAFYTRNDAVSVDEIVACCPLYDEWIRRYFVVVVTLFADRRPTGMTSYPILRQWATAIHAAATRPGPQEYWSADGPDPPDPPDPPGDDMHIRIYDYDKTFVRGGPNAHLGVDNAFQVEPDSGRRITEVEVGAEGGGRRIKVRFPDENGEECRGIRFKPTIDGEHKFLVRAWDNAGQEAFTYGAELIRVTTQGGGNGDHPPGDLPDHGAYVTRRWNELGIQPLPTEDENRAQSLAFCRRMAQELNTIDGGTRWGLLHKPSGNNWQERAIDIIVWNNGDAQLPHWDIIVDATNADGGYGPTWGLAHGLVDASRWRQP